VISITTANVSASGGTYDLFKATAWVRPITSFAAELDIYTVLMARWERFAHGADVGVRDFGESVDQAFEQAAPVLSAVVADVSTIAPSETIG
jgi:archease protein family (MTH1598/TM1083)